MTMNSDPKSLEIQPVQRPIIGEITPPGSKSITNRALIVAAMAEGTSILRGTLESDDTRVMLESLKKLGISWSRDDQNTITIQGCGGKIPASQADLWLENSGTSIRFLTAMCATGSGTYILDGNKRMRERPIEDLIHSLQSLQVDAKCTEGNRCPPVKIQTTGLPGGTVNIAGSLSSQYLSGLLMVAPYAQAPLEIIVEGELVSIPYIEMTLDVMKRFGVEVQTEDLQSYRIEPQKYQGCDYQIEPDASAASYFFAAAAITQGKVTIPGLSRSAMQGDVHFVDVLEEMGCEVTWKENSITVQGRKLQGIDIDMNAISDTAQTLAAVAVFAVGSTRVRNVAHMRIKETDRVAAVVTELKRLGIKVEEHTDGFTIHPGPITPASIKTYDDHRMAMSFSLIGLMNPGIQIEDPACTAKTYPHYFEDLQKLCKSAV
ncbi:3-phosphoshikimate 1-carboxyvinyltransferase [uncultured Rubinisphaera sp.]|uniref:3-phosphoshikimate 1-carboxyvinyltransferase n=1 Tax=uncultured Rubinisphaera sp. TaxID=1678686 RepID=UPI0030D95882